MGIIADPSHCYTLAKPGIAHRQDCYNWKHRGHAAKASTLRLPSADQQEHLVHVPTSNLNGSRYELPSMSATFSLLTVTGLSQTVLKTHRSPDIYHVQVAAECCRASCAISSESAPAECMLYRYHTHVRRHDSAAPCSTAPAHPVFALTRRSICPQSRRSLAPPDSPDPPPHRSRMSRGSPAGVHTPAFFMFGKLHLAWRWQRHPEVISMQALPDLGVPPADVGQALWRCDEGEEEDLALLHPLLEEHLFRSTSTRHATAQGAAASAHRIPQAGCPAGVLAGQGMSDIRVAPRWP